MSTGPAYDKGIRKNQLTGSYGDFKPARIKSEGDRYPVDVVYFKTAEAEGKVWHPTQKPIELGRYLIKTYTQPNDIILDNGPVHIYHESIIAELLSLVRSNPNILSKHRK